LIEVPYYKPTLSASRALPIYLIVCRWLKWFTDFFDQDERAARLTATHCSNEQINSTENLTVDPHRKGNIAKLNLNPKKKG